MQQEPIRDLTIVSTAIFDAPPAPDVLALLGTSNLAALGHSVKSVVVALSGTAQHAAHHGLLDYVGAIVRHRRGVFASEALYDEIHETLKPYTGQLRKSYTVEQLQAAYAGLCDAIVTLATQEPKDAHAKAVLTPETDRVQELERENLQLHRRIAELEAARRAYASEFPLTEDGEPDVGSIHANIRKLKANLAKSS